MFNPEEINFESLQVSLADPNKIREWSRGEVKKPETINYRTQKPEKEGLFCEKIFGPTKDWECNCGKYKRVRHKGTVCENCGVEVTRKSVRRERMGHIELAAPVSHIWYFKGVPSRMGLILEMSPRDLEKVIYFASYVVTDPGTTPLEYKQVLSDNQYNEARELYGNGFTASMGAEAIQELLAMVDLDQEAAVLKEELEGATGQKRVKVSRRLEAVEAFRTSGNKPEWMILEAIPVIPPDLRPMVQLDGGRYATSDLNDLYRRVINRNNRLTKLIEQDSPTIIINNEKRMLQEAVDALIDNGRRGRAITGPGNRAFKSLSEFLKGKQGRFRQNLLGKRVDYSGRSVIVVGPELKMYQCGLPKEMAIELFKPFVTCELVNRGLAQNIKSAKKMVDKPDTTVWDILEDVIKEHPVLLNRAPTLHRLGIQAFEPVLVEGRAIKLHPLACTAYNADFDGDQMAVHVPLSVEAQAEARFLMMACNNILKPQDGTPVVVPTQDMILGSYYLTIEEEGVLGTGSIFRDEDEMEMAYFNRDVHLHARVKVRKKKIIDGIEHTRLVESTVGRFLFNQVLPQDMGFVRRSTIDDMFKLEVDQQVDKDVLKAIVDSCFRKHGPTITSEVLDEIKRLGYKYSTLSGITVSVSDMQVPGDKEDILAAADDEVEETREDYLNGLITEEERYEKVVKIWNKATDDVTKSLLGNLDRLNPISMMADSGARGNKNQIRQLAGMRGLMADPTGRTIEIPIRSNFREGLNISEFYSSSHGARKGLTDTALRTADSGYLTRRLVDVSQDVIVREDDCGTDIGYDVVAQPEVKETELRLVRELKLADTEAVDDLTGDARAIWHLAEDVHDPETKDVIVSKDAVFDAAAAKHLAAAGVKNVSVYRRKSADGIEGTYAATDIVDPDSGKVIVAKDARVDEAAVEAIDASTLDSVRTYTIHIAKRLAGRYAFEDVVDPETGEILVAKNELISKEVAEAIDDKNIQTVSIRSVFNCQSKHGVCKKCYGVDMTTLKPVEIGEAVGIIAAQSIGEPGTQLTMRTFHSGGVAQADDITQGLPRVEELFEARKPKGQAIISEIAGTVHLSEGRKNEATIIGDAPVATDDQVVDADTPRVETGEEKTYVIPYGARLRVFEGDHVEAGDPLTEGSINPNDILDIQGVEAVQAYLLSEVQKVYREQGVDISDKHIEVIIRQMLRKVKVEDSGDTGLITGETKDIFQVLEANEKALDAGLRPAVYTRNLMGITKASLATDSFLSAASFQETTRVLTDAAIKAKIDPLQGLKENVIIGQLIPAGTGVPEYGRVELEYDMPETEEDDITESTDEVAQSAIIDDLSAEEGDDLSTIMDESDDIVAEERRNLEQDEELTAAFDMFDLDFMTSESQEDTDTPEEDTDAESIESDFDAPHEPSEE